MSSTEEKLFLVGDVARVVEPFTGEGIFYALRSGELAAQSIVKIIAGANEERIRHEYERALHAMYAGRLWLNRLARSAVLSPQLASKFVSLARLQPAILRLLTNKVVR